MQRYDAGDSCLISETVRTRLHGSAEPAMVVSHLGMCCVDSVGMDGVQSVSGPLNCLGKYFVLPTDQGVIDENGRASVDQPFCR
jgi:hypothetical protein